MFARRSLVLAGLAGAVPAALAADLSIDWLLGRWRSDRESTVSRWDFGAANPSADTRRRFAEMFGHMSWTIDRHRFMVHDARFPHNDLALAYRVDAATPTSLTLRISARGEEDQLSTVFRVSEDLLFQQAGRNREFFFRVRG